MMFSSSLTFPGHVQFTNAFMVSVGMVSICFFIGRAKSLHEIAHQQRNVLFSLLQLWHADGKHT